MSFLDNHQEYPTDPPRTWPSRYNAMLEALDNATDGLARGLVAEGTSVDTFSGVTSEQTLITVTGVELEAGRRYKFEASVRVEGSSSTDIAHIVVLVSGQSNPVAFGRNQASGTEPAHQVSIEALGRTYAPASTDTVTIELEGRASDGTVDFRGSAFHPMFVAVYDVGPA